MKGGASWQHVTSAFARPQAHDARAGWGGEVKTSGGLMGSAAACQQTEGARTYEHNKHKHRFFKRRTRGLAIPCAAHNTHPQ